MDEPLLGNLSIITQETYRKNRSNSEYYTYTSVRDTSIDNQVL